MKPTPSSRQFQPAVAQAKNETKTSPVAPPVYRPQPMPRVLQQKSNFQPLPKQADRKPVAPPVYRPQALPKVLQAKPALLLEIDLHEEALRFLEYSVDLYGIAPGTAYNMGVCYFCLGQPERALAHVNQALELDPAFDAAELLRAELIRHFP